MKAKAVSVRGEHHRGIETLTNVGQSTERNNVSSDLLLAANLKRIEEVVGVLIRECMADVGPSDIGTGDASESGKMTVDRLLTFDAA